MIKKEYLIYRKEKLIGNLIINQNEHITEINEKSIYGEKKIKLSMVNQKVTKVKFRYNDIQLIFDRKNSILYLNKIRYETCQDIHLFEELFLGEIYRNNRIDLVIFDPIRKEIYKNVFTSIDGYIYNSIPPSKIVVKRSGDVVENIYDYTSNIKYVLNS